MVRLLVDNQFYLTFRTANLLIMLKIPIAIADEVSQKRTLVGAEGC